MSDPQPGAFMLSLIPLDRQAAAPLYRQIYDAVRAAVLGRRLPPGTRLPATRELAALLGVSRNTVVNAFDQLLAEGYLETRVGAGTFINSRLPEEYLQVEQPNPAQPQALSLRTLSQRGQAYGRGRVTAPQQPHPVFPMNQPDLAAFPFDLWARLVARHYRQASPSTFDYLQHPAGYPPLRAALAAHLWTSRGVRCSPEQIVIVSGSQQGLYLAGQILLDPGDTIWMEDPGYGMARQALQAGGAHLFPVPVDRAGLLVAAGLSGAPQARAAYITPSHQFPLGYTMSLARRLELLQWAAAGDSWIIEDDYDSEYHYGGSPLASLQGLDVHHRVIYVGTFSKTIFPQLRLGYLVVPEDLAATFTRARGAINLQPPLLPQMVLADFITEGHFLRHLRRMRKRYQERRDALLAALHEELAGLLSPGPAHAGLHLAALLPPDVDDVALYHRAAEHGVTALPLSWYYLDRPSLKGLVLGFASATPRQIRAGVRRLAQAFTA